MDAATAKANQHRTWQSVAPGWKRHDERLRSLTRPVTERLLAAVEPGHKVLDIAAGTGEPAIPAALKVGPAGSVLATDLVDEMLAFAREKAAGLGLANLEFRCVDGEALDAEAGAFDVVTMRWGLMFMPDPAACLMQAKRSLKPGGTLALACWAGPEKNPWAAIPIGVLKRHVDVPTPPPDAPGLFAFADEARLRRAIESAGFSDVRLEELELTMADFETGRDFVQFTLDLAGPIAALFAAVPEAKREAVADEIAREAEAAGNGRPHLKGVTWIATARA